jgi:hypothetical protein
MRYGYGAVRGKPYGVGRRGGIYWSRGRKPRYDPGVRSRIRGYGRRARAYGSKIEAVINRHAGKIGAGLGALAGIGGAISTYNIAYGKDALSNYFYTIIGGKMADGTERPPEIMHLFKDFPGWTPLEYVKYKFGLKTGGYGEISAWAVPFWASLIAWIVSKFKVIPPRYNKPLEGISKGALVVSTIGALALPGCPGPDGHTNSAPNYTYNIPRTNYVYGK